jgi:hypothetical protein
MEGASGAVAPLLFGSFFSGVGLYFLLKTRDGFTDGTITSMAFVMLVMGIVILSWLAFVIFFFFAAHFGGWSGSVTRGELHPGDSFRFQFEQHFRLNMEIESIGMFLVFRETSGYGETLDRLIQGFSHQGRLFKAGEYASEECLFQIPNRPMGIRSQFIAKEDHPVVTTWWVKVRLKPAAKKRGDVITALLCRLGFIPQGKNLAIFGHDDDFWREFEIEVTGENTATEEDSTDLFDIYLSECSEANWAQRQAIGNLVPHLDADQLDQVAWTSPLLLRERVSASDAEEAKAMLAAHGVDVSIKSAGHLPIQDPIDS